MGWCIPKVFRAMISISSQRINMMFSWQLLIQDSGQMFRVLRSLRNFATKHKPSADNESLKKMAEKLNAMKQSMTKTSPRSLSFLMVLSTIPTFYFGYQIMSSEYHDQSFSEGAQSTVKYFYVKNLMFLSCGIALWNLKFFNPTGKFTVDRRSKRIRSIALMFSLIGLFAPPIDNEYIVFPAIMTDIFTMIVEVQLTNQGVLPFWYYSFRHYIRFFDFLVLIMTFMAMKRMADRRRTHPYLFTVLESDTQNQSQEMQTSQ